MRESRVPRALGTEGASLPANLSGHQYRISEATLKSRASIHTD
jgi:hypothetical protein